MAKFKSLFLLQITIILCACNHDRATYISGKRYNSDFIKSLKDTSTHNTLKTSLAINNVTTAVGVVEQILFAIYGKENITEQQPYEVQKIDRYYIINGTRSRGTRGGVFLVVIDSKDSKIVRLTHGK